MILNFWDASAVVPLLLAESSSNLLADKFREMPGMALWFGTRLECLSALSRRRREGTLKPADCDRSKKILDSIAMDALVIEPASDIWRRAERLLDIHPLKSGDALQLAAALAWCRERPAGRHFVCLDDGLREAARREGFTVLPE